MIKIVFFIFELTPPYLQHVQDDKDSALVHEYTAYYLEHVQDDKDSVLGHEYSAYSLPVYSTSEGSSGRSDIHPTL